nr:amidase family protein [Achromobacter sp. DMS1]
MDEARTLALAQAADLRRAHDCLLGPLDGLPIAIKDLCEMRGRVTTAGSLAWRGRRSPLTATVVERLLAAVWCRWARRTWWNSPSAAGARTP